MHVGDNLWLFDQEAVLSPKILLHFVRQYLYCPRDRFSCGRGLDSVFSRTWPEPAHGGMARMCFAIAGLVLECRTTEFNLPKDLRPTNVKCSCLH